MAGCGCGGAKRGASTPFKNALAGVVAVSATPAANGPSVSITYAGPVGNHLVPSPTRRIANYGMHTRGDAFLVFETDQKALPSIFVLVPEPEVVP